MLTRVVVVAFVCSVMFSIVRREAQATTQPVAVPPRLRAPPAAARDNSTLGHHAAARDATDQSQSAEETLRQMLQPQGEAARPLRPVEEAPPQVDADVRRRRGRAGAARRGTLLREGTLLLDRVGRLTRGGDDGKRLEFTIDSDGRAMADAPMILLPNRGWPSWKGQVQTSYRDLKIRVSGEVMEYRGRNYLLLQRWSVVPDVAQPLRSELDE